MEQELDLEQPNTLSSDEPVEPDADPAQPNNRLETIVAILIAVVTVIGAVVARIGRG